MQFSMNKRLNQNLKHYPKEDIQLARKFAKGMYEEFGTFIRAVVIFGSTAKGKKKQGKGDIDILVIVDDITMDMNPEVVEAYRIITEKLIAKVSVKLHIISLRFTSFWEYVKSGDPVGINMLRDGVALIDTGFFDPLQVLLMQGRIRPTEESIRVYYARAPRTLYNSKWHVMQAVVDLYWAVIDAAHAALMRVGEVPPSPDHVAELLELKLVNKHKLEAKYAQTMRNFYRLMKMIEHRDIKEIKGAEYDKYYKTANDFVNRMNTIIEGKRK